MQPASAVSLWLHNNQIHMAIPSTLPDGQGHTLVFDDDLAGRARIFAILRERANTVGKISTRSAPTQRQLASYDKVQVRRVTKPKPSIAPSVAQAAKEVMRALGMI
jgi:hypothetical protein